MKGVFWYWLAVMTLIVTTMYWEHFTPDARLCIKAGGHYQIGGSCGVFTYKEIKYK